MLVLEGEARIDAGESLLAQMRVREGQTFGEEVQFLLEEVQLFLEEVQFLLARIDPGESLLAQMRVREGRTFGAEVQFRPAQLLRYRHVHPRGRFVWSEIGRMSPASPRH